MRILLDSEVERVVDLGCGSGELLRRLILIDRFRAVVGVDESGQALIEAERTMSDPLRDMPSRLSLVHASFLDPELELPEFDAAVMVEAIEHIPPERLSVLERNIFLRWRPGLVIITTPNHEYNPILGLRVGEYRHPQHRFEWSRARFQAWAAGVARRAEYTVTHRGIGPTDAHLGHPTQVAIFRRQESSSSATLSRA